ncbi:MAG: FAD-binding domain-containing protein [Pseudomonadota bacterium]
MQVVWFKRDLRVQDHRALSRAAEHGNVLPLYIVEPALWQESDMSGRHWGFLEECLHQLREDLADCGQPLIVRVGEVLEVFAGLRERGQFDALWSHQETGNAWTFRRDLRVKEWCRSQGIAWQEMRNHGVQRGLVSRNGWAKNWDQFMGEPVTEPPKLAPLQVDLGSIPALKDLGLAPDLCPDRQQGSRALAVETLASFLAERGETYRRAMSTPVEGERACSRLSPHLAFGTVSMREVAQATWARQRSLKEEKLAKGSLWRGSMRSFSGRLHWHCHFMQKLEDEPSIETENFHKAYDGIRPSAPDRERLLAWANGETGLPFLVACMRYLRATGWLNFRMRAMVMATASYHLWLDWRAPGLELARLFTDYEPGIHWSQVQMQSGTTGINTVRIYNPVKQGNDQDPTGAFTRRWVPELDAIADKHLQTPWKAENAESVVGKAYPARIVDHEEAARLARTQIWAVRRKDTFHAEASAIQQKHGSRKSGISATKSRKGAAKPRDQMELPI